MLGMRSWIWAVGLVALSLLTTRSVEAQPGPAFIRGDVNQDGSLLIDDPIFLLGELFGAGNIACENAADANDDDLVNIADPIYQLSYLFGGGPPPPDPFPWCGGDWDGTLQCDSSTLACLPSEHTYVLEATAAIGAGPDRVLEIEKDPFGNVTVSTFFGGASTEYDGLVHLGVMFDSELFLVQENDATGVRRLLHVGFDGAVQGEVANYPGEAQALVASDYGEVYLVTTSDAPASTWVLRYDPWSGLTETVVWQTDEQYDVVGASVDWDGRVVFTGSGSAGTGLFAVDATGAFSLFVAHPNPGPIQFWIDWGGFWMASVPAGTSGTLDLIEVSGLLLDSIPLPGPIDPVVGDLGIQGDRVLVALPEAAEVLEYDWFGFGFATAFDASEGLVRPIDATGPFTFAIP